MTERQESAVTLFLSGLNCAQSVLSMFCADYGLAPDMARKLACGFGGGCRSGELCGAVAAGVLVIGLQSGQSRPEDTKAKNECYARTKAFMAAFRGRHGSVVCRDLLGHDISSREGYDRAAKAKLFQTTCADIVKNAVAILEEQGYGIGAADQ